MLNGRKSVRNDQHGANVFHLLQRILDQDFRLGVDVGRCFVQNHHRRTVDDGPGKGKQLPLSGGEIIAPLPDDLIQSLLLTGDEGIGVDIFAGLPNFLVSEAVLPQDDVAADGAGE